MRTWADWRTIHQPYELRYHVQEGITWCRDEERFAGFWQAIFDFVGVQGRRLDVGCGPRPPFGQGSAAIDPLATRYRRLVPEWWAEVDGVDVPAEERVPRFIGRFDTVLCWNCLDHTIGWRAILRHLAAYGAPGATYAIATDFGPPAIGHPGFERGDFFEELERHFTVIRGRENFQERDVALVLR